jgi:hypothetical protein
MDALGVFLFVLLAWAFMRPIAFGVWLGRIYDGFKNWKVKEPTP